jgi:hypothetical protein
MDEPPRSAMSEGERWLPGDVVLAADRSLWCRAQEHDLAQGWPWAYCDGMAPKDGIGCPSGSVNEDYPVRPLTLLVRNGRPVRFGCCLHRPCPYGEVESSV